MGVYTNTVDVVEKYDYILNLLKKNKTLVVEDFYYDPKLKGREDWKFEEANVIFYEGLHPSTIKALNIIIKNRHKIGIKIKNAKLSEYGRKLPYKVTKDIQKHYNELHWMPLKFVSENKYRTYKREKVFVIHRDIVPLIKNNQQYGSILKILEQYGQWKYRDFVENDTSYKQIVVYGIIRYENNILTYIRNSGDKRLLKQLSIGFGGHINPIDNKKRFIKSILHNALKRELKEEIHLKPSDYNTKYLGLIDTNDTKVDKVHLGIAYLINLKFPDRLKPSKEVDNFVWRPLEEVYDLPLETWSNIALNYLKEMK